MQRHQDNMSILDVDFRGSPQQIDEIISEALHSVRNLLGMQVAFVSEFRDGARIFRHVDAESNFAAIQVGAWDPLDESYCQRIVDGRLPPLMQDAGKEPAALALAVTTQLPVGAHLSVPIRFKDGRVYGTFCCFSTYADTSLNGRDLGTLRLFADFVGKLLERQSGKEKIEEEIHARLRDLLDAQRYTIVYQPIIKLEPHGLVGYEALARFPVEPVRTPDQWFSEAAEIGLQEELELAVLRKALQVVEHLPADVYLSLNVSPDTILKGSLVQALEAYPPERLMLEITEHASISDYARVTTELAPLRRQGLRLAVDDAGAGFASFRHILNLKPDVIKLDFSLIHHIDSDRNRRALAAALIRFAEETGSKVVAEGVETEAELQTLRELNVNKVQGYLLGRPAGFDLGVAWHGADPIDGRPLKQQTACNI